MGSALQIADLKARLSEVEAQSIDAVAQRERSAVIQQSAAAAASELSRIRVKLRAAESTAKALKREQADAVEAAAQWEAVAELQAVAADEREDLAWKRVEAAEQLAATTELRVTASADKLVASAENDANTVRQLMVESEKRATNSELRVKAAEKMTEAAQLRAEAAEQLASKIDPHAAGAEEQSAAAQLLINASEQRVLTAESHSAATAVELGDLLHRLDGAEKLVAEATLRILAVEADAVTVGQLLAASEQQVADMQLQITTAVTELKAAQWRAEAAEQHAISADEHVIAAEMRAQFAEQTAAAAIQSAEAAHTQLDAAKEETSWNAREAQAQLEGAEKRGHAAEGRAWIVEQGSVAMVRRSAVDAECGATPTSLRGSATEMEAEVVEGGSSIGWGPEGIEEWQSPESDFQEFVATPPRTLPMPTPWGFAKTPVETATQTSDSKTLPGNLYHEFGPSAGVTGPALHGRDDTAYSALEGHLPPSVTPEGLMSAGFDLSQFASTPNPLFSESAPSESSIDYNLVQGITPADKGDNGPSHSEPQGLRTPRGLLPSLLSPAFAASPQRTPAAALERRVAERDSHILHLQVMPISIPSAGTLF